MAPLRWLPLALLACTDPLVPASFEGEPLYSHPNFSILTASPVDAEQPRWALFWVPEGLDPAASFERALEQPGSSRPLMISVGTLNLFAGPTGDLLATAPSGARYGVGRIMAYDDVDGDRVRDPEERILGADRFGLFYAPEFVPAADSPTGRDIPAGFHRIEFSLPCSKTHDGDRDCGVPIGDMCRDSNVCGAGACFRTEQPGFPNGMCVATDCPASGAVLFHREARSGSAAVRGWIAACQTAADCRQSDGYHCNIVVGGCLRDRGHEMHLEPIPRDPVCTPVPPLDDTPPADAGPPPADGGRPPPVMTPCDTDEDCVGAPGPQPQHCDREGTCRPDNPGR